MCIRPTTTASGASDAGSGSRAGAVAIALIRSRPVRHAWIIEFLPSEDEGGLVCEAHRAREGALEYARGQRRPYVVHEVPIHESMSHGRRLWAVVDERGDRVVIDTAYATPAHAEAARVAAGDPRVTVAEFSLAP
jgi:hypothetical protein